MSNYNGWDDEHNHWHDSCDHHPARPLDFGPPLETLQQYADRVNRVTNDPRLIEARKRLAPAFTVPRRRLA